MKNLHFENEGRFADFLIQMRNQVIKDNAYATISVVGSFAEIKIIAEYLVIKGLPIFSMDFENPEFSDYYKEYVLELDEDGITIEKAYRRDANGYFYVDGEGIYVLFPSKFPIEKANCGIFGKDELGLHYVEIGDECDCGCCDCCDNECEDDSESIEISKRGVKISKDKDNTIHIELDGNYKSEDEEDRKIESYIDILGRLLDLSSALNRKSSMFDF